MKKTILTIAGSLAISLCAFADKGAAYQKPSNEYNLNWFENWYMGIGVNGNAESTMNMKGSPEVFDHLSGFSSLDEFEQTSMDPGFEFYVGRNIGQRWALELGYTLIGNMNFDGEIAGIRENEVEVKQWNIHLVGIGRLPIGEYFNVFARGGTAYISSEQKITETSTSTSNREKVNTMALTYGTGIEVTWDIWGIRAEYNVIWPANNVRDDFYIADIISGTIYYKFV